MIIVIDKNKCEHVKELSYYDHNVYKLPISIDGHDYLRDDYDECSNCTDYYMGNVIDGKFEADGTYYEGYDEDDSPVFTPDSKYLY